jgi:hypothetical protein
MNAIQYFDEMLGESKPDNKYCAVFVVAEAIAASYQEQNFAGPLGTKDNPLTGIGVADVAVRFDQWVMGV